MATLMVVNVHRPGGEYLVFKLMVVVDQAFLRFVKAVIRK